MDFNIGDLVLAYGIEAIIKGFHKNGEHCVIEYKRPNMGWHDGIMKEYWYEKDLITPIPWEENHQTKRVYISLEELKLLNKEPQYEVY